RNNSIEGIDAFIGGGYLNTIPASGYAAFIGGGHHNKADSNDAVVVGGYSNVALAKFSVVVGGGQDTASGRYSFVANGYGCNASGDYSFAFGWKAKTNNYDSTAVFFWGSNKGHFFIGNNAISTNYRLYVNGSIYSSKGTYVEAPSGKTSTISAPVRKIEQLHGITYTRDGQTRTGIPADELEKVLPSAVQRAPDGHIEGVDYEQLVPVLLEVIKQQQAKIEELERRVAQLERQRGR
ncbi:MAG: hypothetical protein DRQ10_03390, partial [Candidatus Hydrothermota bacterium]